MLPSISLLICLLILINKSVQFQPQNDPNLDHPEPRKQYFDQQILKPRNSRILGKFRPKQTDAEDNRATVTSRGVGRRSKGDQRRYGARERQMRDREGKTDNKNNFRRQGGIFFLSNCTYNLVQSDRHVELYRTAKILEVDIRGDPQVWQSVLGTFLGFLSPTMRNSLCKI